MKFVPYHELGDTPNVIVDGSATPSTVLTLSHWPGSGTPAELADDLSTQIVFRYLDRAAQAVQADAVSNSHFDEDGLMGIAAMLSPSEALARRDAMIDAASFGDFGTYRNREAARVAMTVASYADAARSPLPMEIFGRRYPEQAAALYEELIPRLAEMLDHPDRFQPSWAEEDAGLARSEHALQRGDIRIEERPDLDLAVVLVPEGFLVHEGGEWFAGVHPSAVYNATRRMRVLVMQGSRYVLRYRYETWVQYVSEALAPRVDLTPLAERLSAEEPGGLVWRFDGVDDLTPALHPARAAESRIAPDRFRALVESFLAETAAGAR